MKTDIWMPVFIGDYLSDTMHLTTEQHGAYFLIMMAYWKNKGPIDSGSLQTIARLDKNAWSIAQAILKQFFDTDSIPEKWIHHRIETELSKATKHREEARERAKIAAAARWNK